MALISMAVFDTEENKRTEYTQRTIESLLNTVDFTKHRLIIVDNNSCQATKDLFQKMADVFSMQEKDSNVPVLITLPENVGTARAINEAWKYRKPGESAIKMDNDVVVNYHGWVDEMEEAIARDSAIGIIGLKRKDLIQTTWNEDVHYRSHYKMLPHEPGQRWICVEQTSDVIGTCTMFNELLLEKVGYSYQPGKYGFEDNLFCHRSRLAGFYNCFLSHIDIDHIDSGLTTYQQWKEKHSDEHFAQYKKLVVGMINGNTSIYYNPFE